MHKHIADLWIADLERDPPQAQGVLFNGKGHCCLGRLCVLAGLEPDNKFSFDAERLILPQSVIEWAGMHSVQGIYEDESLSDNNDSGQSFAEIAQTIRKHWKEL